MSLLIAMILISVLIAAAGQILLKIGMSQIGHFDFYMSNAFPIALKIITNIPIMAGLTGYFVSLVIWLMVLSRTEVSFAYPMISLGYIINALLAYYFLGEQVTFSRLVGTCVIVFGVFLIAKS
ncbi:MAG: EamA family transporter [Gammaproteobacteria bacterium]